MLESKYIKKYEEYPIIKISDDTNIYLLGRYIQRKHEKQKYFLTPTEYNLLLVFVRYYNQVLSVDFILENLHEYYELTYAPQNLYVLIMRLRHKLEKKPTNPEILINLKPGYLFNIDDKKGI